MKRMLLIFGVAGGLAAAGVQGQDVLIDKRCLSCHDAATKKVGPSWKDIAAKYKDDKAAEVTLVTKLKEAKGHPKVNLSDAELKAAVSQVLAAK